MSAIKIFELANDLIKPVFVALVVKDLPVSGGDIRDEGLTPGLGRSPEGGYGNPLQYSCLAQSHGQRSLMGYSPQDHKESGTKEATSLRSPHTSSLEKEVAAPSSILAWRIPWTWGPGGPRSVASQRVGHD